MSEPRSKMFQPPSTMQPSTMQQEPEQRVKFGLQIKRSLKIWLDMEAGRRQIQKGELMDEVIEYYQATHDTRAAS